MSASSRILVSLRRLWVWYDGMLETRPLVTQAISTGVICGIGDVIAQQLIERKGWEKYDVRRTAKFSMIGLLFIGPVLRGWYYSLDRILPAKKTIMTGFGKMAMDQLCFAPVFFSVLLPVFGASQGLGIQGSKEKLKKEYWNTLKTNWKLWPAVQMITFTVLPLKFRVLFVQLVSVGWNAYLAWVAFR